MGSKLDAGAAQNCVETEGATHDTQEVSVMAVNAVSMVDEVGSGLRVAADYWPRDRVRSSDQILSRSPLQDYQR